MCQVPFDTKVKIFLIELTNLSHIPFRDITTAVMISGKITPKLNSAQ
jgi:hypothetical protein